MKPYTGRRQRECLSFVFEESLECAARRRPRRAGHRRSRVNSVTVCAGARGLRSVRWGVASLSRRVSVCGLWPWREAFEFRFGGRAPPPGGRLYTL